MLGGFGWFGDRRYIRFHSRAMSSISLISHFILLERNVKHIVSISISSIRFACNVQTYWQLLKWGVIISNIVFLCCSFQYNSRAPLQYIVNYFFFFGGALLEASLQCQTYSCYFIKSVRCDLQRGERKLSSKNFSLSCARIIFIYVNCLLGVCSCVPMYLCCFS